MLEVIYAGGGSHIGEGRGCRMDWKQTQAADDSSLENVSYSTRNNSFYKHLDSI